MFSSRVLTETLGRGDTFFIGKLRKRTSQNELFPRIYVLLGKSFFHLEIMFCQNVFHQLSYKQTKINLWVGSTADLTLPWGNRERNDVSSIQGVLKAQKNDPNL